MKRSPSRRSFCTALGAVIALSEIYPAVAEKHLPYSVHSTPRPLPEVGFKDGKGKEIRLADFKGRVVLLNIWATWCPPCRHEMPALDRVQGRLGSKDFEVLALSTDRAGMHAVEAFFKDVGVKNLRLYIDQSSAAIDTLAVVGLPTTLLIDREGREVWRNVGPAEWDSDEWVQEIRKAIEVKGQ